MTARRTLAAAAVADAESTKAPTTRKSTTTTPKETAVSTTTAPKSTRTRKAAPKAAPAHRPGLLDGVSEKLAVRAALLTDKEPSDLHVDMAAWMTALTGTEVTPKMAQIVANLRMDYQASEANKSRATYRGLDEVTVAQRSVHMTQAHIDAKAEKARLQAEAEKAEKAATRKPRAPRKPRTPKADA